MQSPGYSRTNLRRIETRRGLLTVCILLIVCFRSQSQEVTLSAVLRDGDVRVDARFDFDETDAMFDYLGDGLKSEIVFEFRLYEQSEGFFSFLGDRLLLEKHSAHTAHFDMYSGKYVIVDGEGEQREYVSRQSFLHEFFAISDYVLSEAFHRIAHCYILARIRLNPVKLVPPLSVIALFFETGSVTSQWHRGSIR